jgi:hypothetical protein
MLNLIACFMTQDVMREQFQMVALRNELAAPKLRWRVSGFGPLRLRAFVRGTVTSR